MFSGSGRRLRLIAGALVLVLFGSTAVLAHASYLDHRYLLEKLPIDATPGFRISTDWYPLQGWSRTVEGARIGVVGPSGAFAQYLFYGPRRDNRVSYLGQEGPRDSIRPATGCRQWRKVVNRFDPDFLVFRRVSSQVATWSRRRRSGPAPTWQRARF